MIKYFVDNNGNYIGSFDGATPPAGSIEVATAPVHARDKHLNGGWVRGLDPIKEEKYREVWVAAESLVSDKANEGGTHPDQRKRLDDKSQKRLMKRANGQSLTANEQVAEDWLDGYLGWADTVRDKADLSCDAVEQLSTPEDVIAYDVGSIVWPVFAP